MTRRSVSAFFLAVFVGLFTVDAIAESWTYEGNRSRTCLPSVLGSVTSGSEEVTLIFNSNGTGTQMLKSVNMTHLVSGSTSTTESTCDFTFTRTPTGQLTLTYAPCLATNVLDPTQRSERSNIVLHMRAIDNRKKLIMVQSPPTTEVLTFLPDRLITVPQVCQRQGVFLQVHDGDD
jgi:hypothetical protein